MLSHTSGYGTEALQFAAIPIASSTAPLDRLFEVDEVRDALNALYGSKVVGLDGIPLKFWKKAASVLTPP